MDAAPTRDPEGTAFAPVALPNTAMNPVAVFGEAQWSEDTRSGPAIDSRSKPTRRPAAGLFWGMIAGGVSGGIIGLTIAGLLFVALAMETPPDTENASGAAVLYLGFGLFVGGVCGTIFGGLLGLVIGALRGEEAASMVGAVIGTSVIVGPVLFFIFSQTESANVVPVLALFLVPFSAAVGAAAGGWFSRMLVLNDQRVVSAPVDDELDR